MTSYLIEYHRPTGEVSVTSYDDAQVALAERINRSRTRENRDTEIVTVRAQSMESLRKTHARYFARSKARSL